MRDYTFGFSTMEVKPEAVKELGDIARRFGFKFVMADSPRGNSWFAGPGKGMPMDQIVQAEIEKAIEAAGLKHA